jgi:hypothetical protein
MSGTLAGGALGDGLTAGPPDWRSRGAGCVDTSEMLAGGALGNGPTAASEERRGIVVALASFAVPSDAGVTSGFGN